MNEYEFSDAELIERNRTIVRVLNIMLTAGNDFFDVRDKILEEFPDREELAEAVLSTFMIYLVTEAIVNNAPLNPVDIVVMKLGHFRSSLERGIENYARKYN